MRWSLRECRAPKVQERSLYPLFRICIPEWKKQVDDQTTQRHRLRWYRIGIVVLLRDMP